MLVILLLAATVVAGEEQPRRCSPRSDTVWAFCSHHKTGSMLLDGLLADIDRDVGDARHVVLDNEKLPLEAVLKTPLVEWARRRGTSRVQWKHINVANTDHWLAERNRTRPKVVVISRDPMEIILSGYFYHVRTTERWANTAHFNFSAAPFQSTCETRPRGDIAGVAGCIAAELLVKRGQTYREVLNAVDLQLGIMIEGIRALYEFHDLARTRTALSAPETCHYAIHCFLEDVVDNLTQAFTEVFDFLDPSDPSRCLQLAQRHDIFAHRRTKTSHEPGHAMSSELLPLRDGIRAVLAATPWFIDNVEPIRKLLGLPPVGTPIDESRPRCIQLCNRP